MQEAIKRSVDRARDPKQRLGLGQAAIEWVKAGFEHGDRLRREWGGQLAEREDTGEWGEELG